MLKAEVTHLVLAENSLCNAVCRVCHYKELDYATQLTRKRQWADDQLGSWGDVLRDIQPAPLDQLLAYRSKSWLRCHFENGEVSFGMFRSVKLDGRWEKEFISWNTCPLHSLAIQDMIQKLRLVFSKSNFSMLQESLVGIWVGSPHLVIVATDRGAKDPALRGLTGLKELMESLDWKQILTAPFDRVWFHTNSQVGRRIFGHRPIEWIAGVQENEGVLVHPVLAFRQVAQTLVVQARELALDALLRAGPALVLDLYCGTGELSLGIPSETGWVGIELSKEAVKYANFLRPSQPSQSSQNLSGDILVSGDRNEGHWAIHAAFAGAVEQRLCDPRVLELIGESYALYLNPPRSGLSEEALERVLALVVERPPTSIVYLSCSASSLARDLEEFEKVGWKIKLLQPYDFFPQTEHFETLAILEVKCR